MTEKKLGPEGARFKKGSWAPTNEGSGTAKRTYLDEREALEARNAELEAKVAELREAVNKARAEGRIYFSEIVDPELVEWRTSSPYVLSIDPANETRNPPGIAAYHQDWMHKVDSKIQRIKSIFDEAISKIPRTPSLSNRWNDQIDAERFNGLEGKYADDDFFNYGFNIDETGYGLLCPDPDAEFLYESGQTIDLKTPVWRTPVDQSKADKIYDALGDYYVSLGAAEAEFRELAKSAITEIARGNNLAMALKMERRNLILASVSGWVVAALIWYF